MFRDKKINEVPQLNITEQVQLTTQEENLCSVKPSRKHRRTRESKYRKKDLNGHFYQAPTIQAIQAIKVLSTNSLRNVEHLRKHSSDTETR